MIHFFSSIFKTNTYRSVIHIESDIGFHLRPAAAFAAEAKKSECRVEVEYRGERVDAKDPQALLALGMEPYEHFDLICSGKNAQVTLTHLETFIASLWEKEKSEQTHRDDTLSTDKSVHADTTHAIKGISLSKGVAVAPIHRIENDSTNETPMRNFAEACIRLKSELDRAAARHDTFAKIAEAQRILLESLCETHHDYESFREAVERQCRKLEGSANEAKCGDYRDLLKRLTQIAAYNTESVDYPQTPFILAIDELTPSTTAALPSQVVGVLTTRTPINGHAAMLLRAASIPALKVDMLPDTTETVVVLDTTGERLHLEPTERVLQEAQKALQAQTDTAKVAENNRFEAAVTSNGRRIRVYANVNDIASAEAAKEAGAEGIGLLRTEFLCERGIPDMETQVAYYKKIFSYFSEITVRTFDIGGDKPIPGISFPNESNPFLGIRGIRLLRHIPKVFETQLSAIYRAAENKAIRIMFPMVDTPERFEEAKTFALDTAQQHGADISNIRFGMMVEVPSVLFDVARFDAVVDFYSIGTNDLAQYLFAVDRTHPTLSYDPHAPALLHALAYFVSQTAKPVSLCGELAADLEMTQALTELGIEIFSVPPAAVAALKEKIRHV